MGFPSDSFGNEPGTNKEIQTWYWKHYKITFPIFAKVDVNSNPLFRYLTLTPDKRGVKLTKIYGDWTKFFIDEGGKLFKRKEPVCEPKEFSEWIDVYMNIFDSIKR